MENDPDSNSTPPSDPGFQNQPSAPPPPQPGTDPGPFGKMATMFSPYPPVAPLGQGNMKVDEEKMWAMGCHIGAIVGLSFIAPLVILLTQKDRSPFLEAHAKESLNFQITFFILAMICMVLSFMIIPVLFLMGYGILVLIGGIVGGIKAYEGGFIPMPFTFRIVK